MVISVGMAEMRDAKKRLLAAFPIFADGPDALVDELLAAGRVASFPAGMQVYMEGDSCGAIAFLFTGDIRVFKTAESGREITLYDIGPGETCILNASCIMTGEPYPANATAVEGGEMLLVTAPEFKRLISRYEPMMDFVFGVLGRRLTGVIMLVEEVAFGRMDERLMDYLVEKSEDGRLASTHQKIADDLGTSREVVSRLLKEFERRGGIKLARNMIEIISLS